jgi:hypothetical protein
MVLVGIAVDSATQDQAIVHLRAVVGVLDVGESQGRRILPMSLPSNSSG